MARILSLFVLPVVAIGMVVYLLPGGPKRAQKMVNKVTHAITSQVLAADEGANTPAPAPSVYERLVVPTVTVGPELAQSPELRIWAIRNDRNYGWIQLPRGTEVLFIRQEGDYYIVRYEETIIRAHRAVIESGLVILKKSKMYAMAY